MFGNDWDKMLWAAVRDAAVVGILKYHAPLDFHPRCVNVRCFKNGKVRVNGQFTADIGHLERFIIVSRGYNPAEFKYI